MANETKIDSLPDAFERNARTIFDEYPTIMTKWESTRHGGRRLTIYKIDESGFDIAVQAETYGLYPYAGDWHGPAWDSGTSTEELCREFLGFVRSLLCEDSSLEVKYAGSRPFKWILSYPTEQGRESYEMGLFIVNYFGKRSSRIFRNRHLPPRYK